MCESRRVVLALLAVTVGVGAASCSSLASVCYGVAQCGPDNDASVTGLDGSASAVDGGDAAVDPPVGCDPKLDPKDAPACVVDGYGVFVDAANGHDDAAGTKAAPVQTISAAFGKRKGKPRVYVCEGTYAEHVVVAAGVSIFGGFQCGSWSYSGTKSKLAPSDKGYGLEVTGVNGATFSDLDIAALSGTAAGESSIAVFVASSTATFSRVAMTASEGFAGASNTQKAQDTNAATGSTPTGTTGGAGAKRTCVDGDSIGGNGGTVGADDATAGVPNLTAGQPGKVATSCISGGGGIDGTEGGAALAATVQASLGALTLSGWTPASGTAGMPGARAQGGGGGGSRTGAGGGGGAGGCGGAGGEGGGGGGASVALLVVSSNLSLVASQLTTQKAGNGGGAAAGQLGQPPGGGGGGGTAAPFPGCPGGQGGPGGNGGAGSGGAGGVSAPVLYSGARPTTDGTTTLVPGVAGTAGMGAASNDGPPGKNDPMLAVP